MYLWKDARLQLSLTRLGGQYLLALLLMGAFAVNSGNNLVYAVFSLMLGLFLLSGWVSRKALREIEPVRIEEGNIFARVRGGIRIRVKDRAPRRIRALEFRLDMEQVQVEPGFYAGGSGSEQGMVVLHARPEERGLQRIRALEIRTAYPFGLMEKAWRFPVDQAILVLPHPRTATNRLQLIGSVFRAQPLAGSTSPVGARPYRTGDPLTRIHWKRTAQRGEPWVRHFEGEQPEGVHLLLDLRRWAPGRDFERELERLSGGVLQARLQSQEVSLDILGRDGRSQHIGHTACWRALALAEAMEPLSTGPVSA